MATGFVRAFEPEHGSTNDARSVQHHETVHGPYEFGGTRTPSHDLGNRQLLESGRDFYVQICFERCALAEGAVEKHWPFGRVTLLQRFDGDPVLAREAL